MSKNVLTFWTPWEQNVMFYLFDIFMFPDETQKMTHLWNLYIFKHLYDSSSYI